MAAHGEGAADEAAVHAADDTLANTAHEATAQRAGVVEEYRAWVRPWGFGLSDVTGTVDVWQGTEDHLVPAAWPRRLASGLPRSVLHLVDGVGHFLLLTRARDVFSALTATD
jgi:pimeloyl-ACP methyl ester carboxylesterase